MDAGILEEAAGTNSDVEYAPEIVGDNEDAAEEIVAPQPTEAAAGGGPQGRRTRAVDQGWSNVLPTNDLPEFTGLAGVNQGLTNEVFCDPLALFDRFITEDMLKIACAQTNLYYHQWATTVALANSPHQRPWTNLTVNELKTWIGILINNSLHPYPTMPLYWSADPLFGVDKVKKAMSLVRFEQIKRFFHLADSSHEPRRGTNDFDPLYKVRPWLSALLSNSQEMFKPGQNVSIDEMDVSFKGRSAYKSRIKFKRAGDGFLNYALCDPECGYTWAFYFQFDTRIPQEPGLSKTFNAVYQLMGQLPGDGHHVFVDNLYSSCNLAEKLLEKKHMYTCTARSDRIPEIVKQKTLHGQAAEQARGTVKWAARRNVVALTCYDNKPVPMITTGHHTMEDVTFTRRRVRIDAANGLPHTAMVELTRLNVIHDYNCHMDGVDVADQLRGYYSCWLKSMKWWHAILFWMLDTAMCNAYIMHKEGLKGQAAPTKSHLQFQTALAHKLLDADAGSKHASSSGLKRKRPASAATERPQSRLLGSHLVQTIQGSRASVTPQRDCVLCKEQGKRSRSNYECSACNVGLHPGCFAEWHQP